MIQPFPFCVVSRNDVLKSMADHDGCFVHEFVAIKRTGDKPSCKVKEVNRQLVEFTVEQTATLLKAIEECNGGDDNYQFELRRLPASVQEAESNELEPVDAFCLFDGEYPEEGILWGIPEVLGGVRA